MMFQKVVFSFLAICTLSLSAQAYTMNVSNLTDGEELARAGEQLITPSGFFHADKIFDMALKAESDNTRALFYKSFLKQFMVFKGIYARIRPLAVKLNRVADLDKAIAEIKDSNLKNFLLNGIGDIQDEVGIQNFMVEYRNAYNQLRLFAKRNKELEFTLYLPAYAWQSNYTLYSRCNYYYNNYQLISWSCTDYPGQQVNQAVTEVTLGYAEMESLQQMAGGMVLAWTFYTGYNLAGLKDLSDKIQQHHLKPPQVLGLIKSMPQFLRLRSDNSMATIVELGADYSIAARWVLANQDTLCKPGSQKVCIGDDPQTFLEKILRFEAQLSGPTFEMLHLGDGSVVTTQVDNFALSKNPVVDLKALLPTAVDNCGQAYGYSDKTFGGMLPLADIDSLIRLKPCNLNK
jgi:hypothetical protein